MYIYTVYIYICTVVLVVSRNFENQNLTWNYCEYIYMCIYIYTYTYIRLHPRTVRRVLDL